MAAPTGRRRCRCHLRCHAGVERFCFSSCVHRGSMRWGIRVCRDGCVTSTFNHRYRHPRFLSGKHSSSPSFYSTWPSLCRSNRRVPHPATGSKSVGARQAFWVEWQHQDNSTPLSFSAKTIHIDNEARRQDRQLSCSRRPQTSTTQRSAGISLPPLARYPHPHRSTHHTTEVPAVTTLQGPGAVAPCRSSLEHVQASLPSSSAEPETSLAQRRPIVCFVPPLKLGL
jgi:hypothetical protein